MITQEYDLDQQDLSESSSSSSSSSSSFSTNLVVMTDTAVMFRGGLYDDSNLENDDDDDDNDTIPSPFDASAHNPSFILETPTAKMHPSILKKTTSNPFNLIIDNNKLQHEAIHQASPLKSC